MTLDKSQIEFRMYENPYPEINDLVVVNIKSISEMGVYVSLLEYNNIEGMVLLSELSRRRFRSVNRLVKIGRTEILLVIRVDKEKGYIDLSKRRVAPEDIPKCEERYSKAKIVHTIVKYVARVESMPTEEIYKNYIWPLSEFYNSPYEAFLRAIKEPNEVFGRFPTMPKNILEKLLNSITKKLKPSKIKIRSDIELSCYEEMGINAIKGALQKGFDVGSPEFKIEIKLLAPPLYVITVVCFEKEKGLEVAKKAINEIKNFIEAYDGVFLVKMFPKIVNDVDDKELQARMAQAEIENTEIAADSDESLETKDYDF